MPKYKSGNYFTYFFDRYGARVKDKVLFAKNLTHARQLGDENKDEGSYAVVRVIYNSLDPHPTAVVPPGCEVPHDD